MEKRRLDIKLTQLVKLFKNGEPFQNVETGWYLCDIAGCCGTGGL